MMPAPRALRTLERHLLCWDFQDQARGVPVGCHPHREYLQYLPQSDQRKTLRLYLVAVLWCPQAGSG